MAFVPFQTVANFENISTRAGGASREGGYKTLVAGCYRVKVLDCGLNVKEGQSPEDARSISFAVEVIEGEYTGTKSWVNTGFDMSKLGNRIAWKTILVSLGYDESSLEGDISIDTSAYIGMDGYMKFTPKKEGEQYDGKEFVVPAYYENWKASQNTTPAAPITTTFKTTTPAVAKAPAAPTAAAPARAAGIPQPAAGAANKYAGLIAK